MILTNAQILQYIVFEGIFPILAGILVFYFLFRMIVKVIRMV